MESDKNKFEQVTSRIQSQSPCAIVLSSGYSSSAFSEEFLHACSGFLSSSNILPVRVECAQYPDSISIWKGIAEKIKFAINSVFSGNTVTKKSLEIIESATSTDIIKSYLVRVLEQTKKHSGWTVLLMLEDFENVVDTMEDYDIMKIRGMTTSLIIVSVSHSPLETLGQQKYANAYFCNQFVTFLM